MMKYILIYFCLFFMGCKVTLESEQQDTSTNSENTPKIIGKIGCEWGVSCEFVSLNTTDGTKDRAYRGSTYTIICRDTRLFIVPIDRCIIELYPREVS